MLVSPFHALIDHPAVLPVDLIDPGKGQAARHALPGQQLVLQLSAHGHDLLKQFLHPMPVKIVVGKPAQHFQLLKLSVPVQDLLPVGNLVLRHLSADLHSIFK